MAAAEPAPAPRAIDEPPVSGLSLEDARKLVSKFNIILERDGTHMGHGATPTVRQYAIKG